jgi:hypothetical protein
MAMPARNPAAAAANAVIIPAWAIRRERPSMGHKTGETEHSDESDGNEPELDRGPGYSGSEIGNRRALPIRASQNAMNSMAPG